MSKLLKIDWKEEWGSLQNALGKYLFNIFFTLLPFFVTLLIIIFFSGAGENWDILFNKGEFFLYVVALLAPSFHAFFFNRKHYPVITVTLLISLFLAAFCYVIIVLPEIIEKILTTPGEKDAMHRIFEKILNESLILEFSYYCLTYAFILYFYVVYSEERTSIKPREADNAAVLHLRENLRSKLK